MILNKIISIFEYAVVRTLQFVLRFQSYRRISDAGALAGVFFEHIGIRKRVAIENIRRSNLIIHFVQVSQLVSSSYEHLGRTFFELLALDRIDLKQVRDYELILPGRFYDRIAGGAIFISAHIGNWELMGKVLVEKGVPMAVVVKHQQNAGIDRLINRQREKAGMVVVYDDEIMKLRRLIEGKYCIALLSDQDFGDNTVPVNFLGRPCFATAGPVYLANKFQVPVFVCFAIRRSNYFHRFEVNSFELDMSLSMEKQVQSYTTEIEKIVKTYPDQWLWHHKRWKVHA
ncbi:lysophospholipid acyltransferase family protein [bacterium]|nr:lysophospholipid acyltransferase family protein [bacterium]